MTNTLLHIDASARLTDSATRELSSKIVDRFVDAGPVDIIRRDLADGIELIDEAWVGANFTPEEARNDDQRARLATSDRLVDELIKANTIVIGLPIYNFSVPAAFKAWVDQIARVGRTFQYTETGPKGLLEGKRVIVAFASGGTEVGSPIDFASGYIRHMLGFIGIEDVTFVKADQMAMDGEGALARAQGEIAALNIAA